MREFLSYIMLVGRVSMSHALCAMRAYLYAHSTAARLASLRRTTVFSLSHFG